MLYRIGTSEHHYLLLKIESKHSHLQFTHHYFLLLQNRNIHIYNSRITIFITIESEHSHLQFTHLYKITHSHAKLRMRRRLLFTLVHFCANCCLRKCTEMYKHETPKTMSRELNVIWRETEILLPAKNHRAWAIPLQIVCP